MIYMWIWILACAETEKTGDSADGDSGATEVECAAWQDSCGDCSWMCTPASEEPDVVCDQDCSGTPPPQEECLPNDSGTCAYQ